MMPSVVGHFRTMFWLQTDARACACRFRPRGFPSGASACTNTRPFESPVSLLSTALQDAPQPFVPRSQVDHHSALAHCGSIATHGPGSGRRGMATIWAKTTVHRAASRALRRRFRFARPSVFDKRGPVAVETPRGASYAVARLRMCRSPRPCAPRFWRTRDYSAIATGPSTPNPASPATPSSHCRGVCTRRNATAASTPNGRA